MAALKASRQALGAEVLASVQNFAPPPLLGQAARLNFTTRLFNLLVTNVPGPQIPLYVLGGACSRPTRSRSCRAVTRSRSRSSPTTGRSTSGCSPTTTRCRSSTQLAVWIAAELAELLSRATARSPGGRSSAHERRGIARRSAGTVRRRAPRLATRRAAASRRSRRGARRRGGGRRAACPRGRSRVARARAASAGFARPPRHRALHPQRPEGEMGDQRLALGVRARAPVGLAEPGPDDGAAVAPRDLEHAVMPISQSSSRRSPARARSPPSRRAGSVCKPGRRFALLLVGPPEKKRVTSASLASSNSRRASSSRGMRRLDPRAPHLELRPRSLRSAPGRSR